MPYFSCPGCELTLYGEAPASSSDPCPRCRTQLKPVDRPRRPAGTNLRDLPMGTDPAPVTELLTLQARITRRIGRGGVPPAPRPRAERPPDGRSA
jgi:hypothetical protein